MKYKVAQIIPYFGSWPEWIELYFYSCGRNPMVDFIFYTDCLLPKHRYANTIFNQCTFEEYKKLVGKSLGIEYNVERAYKLCDLKPFLGAVHEPELREYAFWGFGDLDVVHGDLGMLVNDKMLTKYDFITTHAYRVAGHFTLCRNNEYYRNLCFKIKKWQKGLIDNKSHGYDEIDWSCLINPFERNIGRCYRYLLKPFGLKSSSVYGWANKVLIKHKHIQEYFTTLNPAPIDNVTPIWIYNLEDNTIQAPNGIKLPYLHFMYFKKGVWSQSEYNWKEDYYKLSDKIELYKQITFDYKEVKGILK